MPNVIYSLIRPIALFDFLSFVCFYYYVPLPFFIPSFTTIIIIIAVATADRKHPPSIFNSENQPNSTTNTHLLHTERNTHSIMLWELIWMHMNWNLRLHRNLAPIYIVTTQNMRLLIHLFWMERRTKGEQLPHLRLSVYTNSHNANHYESLRPYTFVFVLLNILQ